MKIFFENNRFLFDYYLYFSLEDLKPSFNNENEVDLTGTIRECANYTDCGCLEGGDKLYFVDGPIVIEPFRLRLKFLITSAKLKNPDQIYTYR